MPQFDFTTYSSQIFWFAICFAMLYIFLARKILPRIRDIIADRKKVIDSDINLAKKLEAEIADISKTSQELTRKSESQYKEVLSLAVKNAAVKREEFMQNFKDESQKIIEKSKSEIDDLVKNSKEKSDKLVVDLSNLIETKIFN